MTSNKTTQKTIEQPNQLSSDWQERAQEAARRFKIPIPEEQDTGSREDAEQNLRAFEQDGGQ